MGFANSKDASNSNEWSCPHCGSENIDFDYPAGNGDHYWFEFNCADCKASGVQLYQWVFSGYRYDVES